MQAFEFQTTVQNGVIHIPERFKDKMTQSVKVTILNDENEIQYNKETLEAIDDVNNNRNMSPVFDSIDDLMRSLNA